MQFLSKENQRLLRHMRRKASRRSKQRARYNKQHPLGTGPLTQPLRPIKIGIMAFLVDLLARNDY